MSRSECRAPRYYGAFREKVLRGEIPVCETISLEMNRIDRMIEKSNLNPRCREPEFYYDPEPVEGWIRFCENELTLTDGSPLKLLDTFKLWGESLYGWYYYVQREVWVPGKNGRPGHCKWKKVRKRLVNKQYLILGRGGAKSLYGECNQAYGLVCDTSTTQQVAVAPTMNQADEMLAPFRTAIARARGPLFKMMTRGSLQNTTGNRANRPMLAPTKKGIESLITNSVLEVRPMSIPKLQGRRDKYATFDEWLSCPIREDPISAIEQSAAKNPDWWIIAMSSEGTVRNGPGDTIKMELMDILRGEYYNPHVSIWWYKLDSIDELNDRDMWVKAQPNINKTVTFETYMLEKERAEKSPSARNDILAKRFGIPMEGYTFFFPYEETLPHRRREYWQMPCSMGCDLSMGDDFCSFTFLFPLPREAFGVKTRNYISSLTMSKLHSSARQKYEQFIDEGSLVVLEGTVLDMNEVYEDLADFIEKANYDVRCVGYDPYNAKEFIERWARDNGPFGIEKVIQGARTESVPLGELKKLSEERLLLFDEQLMSFAMGNCITLEDTNGNRKLYKQRRDAKIDAVAAMMDAFVAFKLNRDAFD